jgi:uncharacterized protein (TIGR03032 family)
MQEDSTKKDAPPERRIDHEYSRSLPGILTRCRISVLVTTYQAGKLVVVAARPDGQGLTLSYRNYASPMGVAVRAQGDLAALATETQIWQLRNVPALAGRLEPAGEFDACYLPRRAEFTGPIDAHEMEWVGGDLWIVNTLFSCLCTLDGIHNFVPRWRPPFISALAAEDRCHLNGMTCDDQGPRYVTALGETDRAHGWRAGKAAGGCLIDVSSGQTVLKGLSMPHSPRLGGKFIWLLESGRGRLVQFRPESAAAIPVVELPGYARGLALAGPLAFVGLSKIRESSTFGELPIAERKTPLSCGVAVVELARSREVARLEFHTGIEEIFDVRALHGTLRPFVGGPHAGVDDVAPIWVVPEPKRS